MYNYVVKITYEITVIREHCCRLPWWLCGLIRSPMHVAHDYIKNAFGQNCSTAEKVSLYTPSNDVKHLSMTCSDLTGLLLVHFLTE